MCLCKGSLNIRFIGNAAISGAIAIGSSSNILVNPGWSLLVGYVTGTISTLGFVYLDEEF
jgi:ammonium transporter Rh